MKVFVEHKPLAVHATLTAHEHRAPTDESIRLAEEYREKALAAVLEARPLPGNVLGEVVCLRDPTTARQVLQFELNGRRYVATVSDTDLSAAPRRAAEVVGAAVAHALLERGQR